MHTMYSLKREKLIKGVTAIWPVWQPLLGGDWSSLPTPKSSPAI